MVTPLAAFDVFIGGSLLLLALALVTAGRRKSDSWLLVVFLVLVATNFLSTAMFRSTQDLRWAQVGYVTLALDPLFFLLFVTAHPYRHRSPPVSVFIGLVAIVAALGIVLVITQASALAQAWSIARLVPVVELGGVYAAVWFLAVRGAVDAPTPLLRRRAAWLAAAVGVATIPRIALLPADLQIWKFYGEGSRLLVEPLAGAVAMVAMLVPAFRMHAQASRSDLGRPLKLVLVVAVAFLALRVAFELLEVQGGATFRLAVPYGVRWLIFGFILMSGILIYEVLELRSVERVLALLSGAVGGLAGALVGVLLAESRGGDMAFQVASALGGCVAVAWLAAQGTRVALHRFRLSNVAPPGTQRRRELYRASLEAAWASGPPDLEARRDLERDRRAFGVSVEEGWGLEHTVAGAVAGASANLRLGDEAAVGVVLEEVLGEGAHGRVFRARRYPSGEQVVVKEMRDDAGGTQQTRRRLLQEARALQRLDHPNIVRLLDVQAEAGRYLLVMEHVDGAPLSQAMRTRVLAPADTCRVIHDLLDALETVHRQGVVHRDIKPSNILLGKDGRARLTDFGVAALAASRPAHATATSIGGLGEFAGTLAYAAPEQLQGQATPLSDLYSVGLVAYEMLTGKQALRLEGSRMLQALEQVAKPTVDLAPVTGPWRAFIARAVDPRPEGRFPSAAAMRGALLELAPCRDTL